MPRRTSVLPLPPPMATIYEQSPANSSANDSAASVQSDPFYLERHVVIPERQRPIVPAPTYLPDWPLRDNPTSAPYGPPPTPPPNKPLPPVPPLTPPIVNPEHLPAPPRPRTRPAERIVPLEDSPNRHRDFTGTFVAWERYQSKSMPLSQSGALATLHSDLMQRPPGWTPSTGKRRLCALWCFR